MKTTDKKLNLIKKYLSTPQGKKGLTLDNTSVTFIYIIKNIRTEQGAVHLTGADGMCDMITHKQINTIYTAGKNGTIGFRIFANRHNM